VNICKPINCHYPYGFCINNKICKCISGYLHVPSISPRSCGYYQYSHLKALILEILFPGVGCLYIGFKLYGLIKLILLPLTYCVWVDVNVKETFNCCIISLIGYVLIFIQLKDLWLIFTNKMTDKNGVELHRSPIFI